MQPTPPTSRPRPLSPHLQIYRWQWTMGLSILHRATGTALSIGFIPLTAWLWSAAYSPQCYETFMTWIHHPVGQLLLIGWTFALFYHLFAGLRHLNWDLGHGFELHVARRSGYLVVACAAVATAVVWLTGGHSL